MAPGVSSLPCLACGESCETLIGDGPPPDGAFPRTECPRCATVSFHAGATVERYAALYDRGESDEGLAAGAAKARLALLAQVPARLVPPPRLRTADRVIVRIVRERVPLGGRIVDWGCGSGRLVQLLGRLGYDAVGVEVSEDLVRAMRDAGLQAFTLDEAAERDLGSPAAVVLAEVLEHLPDPLSVLRGLADRFPGALVLASVPSPARRAAVVGPREVFDHPPNHLIRFSRDGFRKVFERAGYSAEVLVPEPSGTDAIPLWWMQLPQTILDHLRRDARPSEESSATPAGASRRLRLAAAAAVMWAHWAYISLGRVASAPAAGRRRVRHLSAESMVAVAVADRSA